MAIKKFIFATVLSLLALQVLATHNRAGEISFRHLGGLRYEVTVTTYTEVGGSQADRPFLPIDWGDNSGPDSIMRSPAKPLIAPSIQKNTYIKVHEYGGPGRYMVSVEDPNRNAGVQNIPNSVAVPFYIESELIIDAFAGHNNSVRLLNPPIDFGCVYSPFVHNPAAYDPDGDSIVFSLVASKGFNGVVIPGYAFPAAPNGININPSTGELIWDFPTAIGEYNIAILVEEYKNGIRVGSVLRDMQITVDKPCQHDPPVFDEIEPICVVAGDTLDFNVRADDRGDGTLPLDGDTVILSAFGGVFQIPNPAFFEQFSFGSVVSGKFYWPTECVNVRKIPYQVVFKSIDNGSPHLASFKDINIQVIAPPPDNFTVTPVKNTANLNWDKTICTNATGYKIYRKLGPSNLIPDSCETGVPAYTGFELIHTDSSIENNSFVDNNNGEGLVLGLEYCYRVIAFFADGAESYASKEVCIQLKKELPVITNVSVDSTSTETGRIYLAWSKPTEHDTIVYPGPYRYVIRRKIWNEQFITIDSTAHIDDTNYTDINLNTFDNEYSYIIDMYDLSNGRNFMGSSVAASSIYLTSLPDDNRLIIQWNERVPWINEQYVLYKLNTTNGLFEVLDTVTSTPYVDDSLTNGNEYCYKLESIGGYLVPGIINPIINFSQIHCNIPIDTVPPCPPVLTVETASCIESEHHGAGQSIISPCQEDAINEVVLRWTNPNNTCENVDDAIQYNIYFKPHIEGEFSIIQTLNNPADTFYTYVNENNSVAGCYYVTAVDSFANESVLTDSICIDNCPYYRLPNVFTPDNNDGYNDVFRPFPYCFIESVKMSIFNRWGQVIFETSDPEINWDGRIQDTGESAAEGVYFYVCEVNEIRLLGPSKRQLKGTIHLLRSNKTNNSN